MSNAILAEYEPPREVVALGEPDRLFARSRSATEWLWGSVRGFGFLLVALSSMTLGLFFTTAPPDARNSTPTVAAACILGGFFFVAGAFLVVVPVKPWPAYAYALYPESLAYLAEGTWSVVAWDDVEGWRAPSIRSFWPALVLRDGREVSLRNDFTFPTLLYGAAREYVRAAEIARVTGERPVVRDGRIQPCPAMEPEPDPAQAAAMQAQLRSARRFAAGLAAVGLVMIVVNATWILAAVRGPVEITVAQLAAAADPSALPSPWVAVDLDGVHEAGLRVVSIQSGQREGTAKSRYVVGRVGNRSIVASVPIDHSGRRVVGYLGAWWTPFSKNAVHIIETTRMPVGAGPLLPYQLDAAYEVRSQCAALVAIALVCLASGSFLLFAR